MNKSLLIGIGMLLGAVFFTVVVWFLIQGALMSDDREVSTTVVPTTLPVMTEEVEITEVEQTADAEEVSVQIEAVSTVEDPVMPRAESEGIFLRDLELSDAQISAAETFGIDVATFEITPAMIACAEAQVGAARVAEFKAGATPGFAEGLALLGCME